MAFQCERQFIIRTMCPLWMVKSLFVQFWFCSSCLENDKVYLPLTWIFMRILNMWFSHLLLSPWVFKGKELKSNTYHLKYGFIRSYWIERCVFVWVCVNFPFTKSNILYLWTLFLVTAVELRHVNMKNCTTTTSSQEE